MASSEPYPKSKQLARGERRYRRKVASPKQWQAIIAEKGSECRLASHRCWGEIQYHHLVPRSRGGHDVAANIVPLCAWHHSTITHAVESQIERLQRALTDAERSYVR